MNELTQEQLNFFLNMPIGVDVEFNRDIYFRREDGAVLVQDPIGLDFVILTFLLD